MLKKRDAAEEGRGTNWKTAQNQTTLQLHQVVMLRGGRCAAGVAINADEAKRSNQSAANRYPLCQGQVMVLLPEHGPSHLHGAGQPHISGCQQPLSPHPSFQILCDVSYRTHGKHNLLNRRFFLIFFFFSPCNLYLPASFCTPNNDSLVSLMTVYWHPIVTAL